MRETGPYFKSWCSTPPQEATMYPTITAAIANQRQADLIAEAEQFRRARAARAARLNRLPSTRRGGLSGAVSRPIRVFSSWLTLGQL
jgi:hypothetical protein